MNNFKRLKLYDIIETGNTLRIWMTEAHVSTPKAVSRKDLIFDFFVTKAFTSKCCYICETKKMHGIKGKILIKKEKW